MKKVKKIPYWKENELYSPLEKQQILWKDIVNGKTLNSITELMEEKFLNSEDFLDTDSDSDKDSKEKVMNRIACYGEFLEESGAFKVILDDNNKKYSFGLDNLCDSEINPFLATEQDVKTAYRINYNYSYIEALVRAIDCENKTAKIATAQIMQVLLEDGKTDQTYIVNREKEYFEILNELRKSSTIMNQIGISSNGVENVEALKKFISTNFENVDIKSFGDFKGFSKYVIAKKVREQAYKDKNLDIETLLYEYAKNEQGVSISKTTDSSNNYYKYQTVINIYINGYNQHFSVHLPTKELEEIEKKTGLKLSEKTINPDVVRPIFSRKITIDEKLMPNLKGYTNWKLSKYLEYFESMNLVVDNSKKNSILKKVEQARKKEEQLENSKRHSQYLETRYQNCFVQQGRDK